MRKSSPIVAKIFAGIFAAIFIVSTPLAVFFTAMNGQLFNSGLYKNALVNQDIYANLPEIVGAALTGNLSGVPCEDQLVCAIEGASPALQTCLETALGVDSYQAIENGKRGSTPGELKLAQPCLDQYGIGQAASPQTAGSGNGMPAYMQNLSAESWQAILTIFLPPEALKSMADSALDQFFAYLNGGTDTVSVPLGQLKERLLGPSGAALFVQVLNSQPPCTLEGLAQLVFGSGSQGVFLCKPPEAAVSTVELILPSLLKVLVPQIPDQVVLIKPPAAGDPLPGQGPFGADPVSTVRTLRLLMRLSPLIPLIFLLLVTILAVRDLKSWMRWWGISFCLSGAVTLGLGISILPLMINAWTGLIIPHMPAFIPPVISTTGLALLQYVIHALSGWIILPALVLFTVGLAALIFSYMIKTKSILIVP